MNDTKSLADAMRERAQFLRNKPNHKECGWGDTHNVIAALFEMADVIDSWSGEYLSKELTYEEDQHRRCTTTHWTQPEQPSMTMEERIAAVKKEQSIF